MKKIKFLSLALALILILPLALGACTGAAEVDDELEIRITVLNGTTGFGAAKMINDAKEGKTELNYKFAVDTDPTLIYPQRDEKTP